MDEEKNILAIRINQMRKELDLTQEELAFKLGLKGKSSIANYESGKITPSDEIKLKMCKIFDCSMDYLMGNSDIKNTRKQIQSFKDTFSKFDINPSLFDTAVTIDFNLPEDEKKILDDLLKYSSDSLESGNIKNIDINSFLDKYALTNKQKDDIIKNYIITLESQVKLFAEISLIPTKIEDNVLHKLFSIPVLGKIAAEQPILAEEYLEGYLPVDPNIYGMTTPDDYFYLKVSGESMNLKVHNGDYALVHKQDYADDGDIVVAIVNGDDEATLKKYKRISDETVALEPMSTLAMEPIYINLKETNFKIIGKAIGQFGKF